MASLATASPEEKKTIMVRLRKLGEEMNPTIMSSPATTNKKLGPSSSQNVDHERKERERLDKELEMHNATAAVVGEESTEDLKAKLEKLKAEVY
jgi:RNA-binding protein 26